MTVYETEALFSTPRFEVVWNGSSGAVHKRLGILVGPELARVPFTVAGQLDDGIVLEAVVNTQMQRLLVRREDLAEWRTNALSALLPFQGLTAMLREVLDQKFDLPLFASPAPGFSKEGWGGVGSPRFVSRACEWTPAGDATAIDASGWLNMEREHSDPVLARWARVARELRRHMLDPQAATVINAVGSEDALLLLAVLARVAIGQGTRFNGGVGLLGAGAAGLAEVATSPTGRDFAQAVADAPGWCVPVWGFEHAPSRARLLQDWLTTAPAPSRLPPQPPARVLVLSREDIAEPSRPGRAGDAWEGVAAQMSTWVLPPAPGGSTLENWLRQVQNACPAADFGFQCLP